MNFFELTNLHFSGTLYLELIFRIVVSAVCGGLVGTERSRRFKDAGVRTHSVVACAAALMMIVSKYGFADLVDINGAFFAGDRGADPARIAAQIVTGIGFIGAGIIYRDRNHATRGLTTAAGIWAVAGIGMTIGAGLYVIGIFATIFLLIMQALMHRFTIGGDRYTDAELEIVIEDDPEALSRLHEKFDGWELMITGSTIAREDGLIRYELDVKMPSKELQSEITSYLSREPAVRSISLSETI